MTDQPTTSTEERAKQLLAAEWERLGFPDFAELVLTSSERTIGTKVALGGIQAALAANITGMDALDGYRAGVSFISADSWDGCSDCIEILKAARSADLHWDWAGDSDRIAAELARIRPFCNREVPSRGIGERKAIREAIALIDEINERTSSREFNGINQPLHAKLCTIRATLARAPSRHIETKS